MSSKCHIGTQRPSVDAIRATPRGHYHFFGYYDRCPWDPDDRCDLLSLETDLADRIPSANDAAGLGIVDFSRDRAYRRVAQTCAWNFQEGTKFQWVNGLGEPAFIHNDCREGHFVSVIRNVEGKELRSFSQPVYHVSADGRRALSLNFSRLARTVAGYGYAGVPDATRGELAPENDGVWSLSLDNGRAGPVALVGEDCRVSDFRGHETFRTLGHAPALQSERNQVCVHLPVGIPGALSNPAAYPAPPTYRSRFRSRQLMQVARPILCILFGKALARATATYQSRLLVMDADGGSLRCLADDGSVSHYFWRDDDHLLCWAERRPVGSRYWLFDVRSGEAEVIGEGILDCDGHCTFRHDGRWILTDTDGPNEASEHTLILFDTATGTRIDQGNYHTRPEIVGAHFRCDLHPRFDRRGRRVCFDSTHEGDRQVYMADVAHVVGSLDG